MNIIIATHGNKKKLCFTVPDEMAPHIKKGAVLVVETARGEAIATAVTGVISGPGADDVARAHGAHFPMKPVICVLTKAVLSFARQQVIDQLLMVEAQMRAYLGPSEAAEGRDCY